MTTLFITLEGVEGSGKSTQVRLLEQWLIEEGYRVVVLREPGGTLIGEQIREILHSVDNGEMTDAAEMLLYAASRAQLSREVIRPNLAQKNTIVLCDRYFDSTLAYQGYGRGLNMDTLRYLCDYATDGVIPNITFLLDLDVELGLGRRVENNEEMNRLDLEAIEFHQRVRNGYHELSSLLDTDRWVVIDGDRGIDQVQHDLRMEISNFIEKQNNVMKEVN